MIHIQRGYHRTDNKSQFVFFCFRHRIRAELFNLFHRILPTLRRTVMIPVLIHLLLQLHPFAIRLRCNTPHKSRVFVTPQAPAAVAGHQGMQHRFRKADAMLFIQATKFVPKLTAEQQTVVISHAGENIIQHLCKRLLPCRWRASFF